MKPSVVNRYESNLELARRLGTIAARGALQHFFVSPVLPLQSIDLEQISAAWGRLAEGIRQGRDPELLTLYIHIPFCSHKCRYCIYHSIGDFDPGDLDRYLDRLHAEIDHYAPIFQGVRFATCYLGGGTPTVLGESQLEDLLAHVDRAFERRPGGEWAFECNPLTVTESKARIFERHGYNRVSFGVQTLNPRVLEEVNRGYQSMEHLVETFRVMHACRFWINLDLIHGLPGDTLESMRLSLQRLLEFEPTQVTIYALSPYTPMAFDNPDVLPLDRLAEELRPAAEAAGYRIGFHHTCIDVSNKNALRDSNRLTEEHRAAGASFPYDDTTVEPFSLLGIGPTARCYIYGQLVYVFDPYPVTSPFGPAARIARGRPVGMEEERRRFLVYRLGLPRGLDPAEYLARFGEPLEDRYGQEIQDLVELGHLVESDGVILHAHQEPAERFATELFFVEEEMLAAARRDAEPSSEPAPREEDDRTQAAPEASVDRAGVELRTPEGRVRVVLTDYWPGRPCFHHAGKFAFYIPSELPEGTCSHTRFEEQLLTAFARLFERIVKEDSPTTTGELHDALFVRGNRLRLTIRTDEGPRKIPVELSPWK